jgi:hypothetical protein
MGVDALIGAARTLLADRVTAEVSSAFATAGVPSLLLKGPVIARWLYVDGAVRTYGDSDLLVQTDRRPEAEYVLRDLGFTPVWQSHLNGELQRPGHAWERASAFVDLHDGVVGFRDPWEPLHRTSTSLEVAGVHVPTIGRTACLVHVCVHAAQHGPDGVQSLEDLRRAIAIAAPSLWEQAVELADELEAIPAMALGLAMVPDGRKVIEQLGISPSGVSLDLRLLAMAAPRGTGAIGHVLQARSGHRLRDVAAALFPPRDYLDDWIRVRGYRDHGVLVNYVRRFIVVVRHGPRAAMSLYRATRHHPSVSPPGEDG